MRRILATAAIAAWVAGCSGSKPEDQVTGVWLGDPPMPAELRNDPNFRAFMDLMKDSFKLEIRGDHTYSLECWSEKTGTWRLSGHLVQFEETGSRSISPLLLGDPTELGRPTKDGKRIYTAVLSRSGDSITLLMGKLGDVTFHR